MAGAADSEARMARRDNRFRSRAMLFLPFFRSLRLGVAWDAHRTAVTTVQTAKVSRTVRGPSLTRASNRGATRSVAFASRAPPQTINDSAAPVQRCESQPAGAT